MSFELHRHGHSMSVLAASAITPRSVVSLVGTDTPLVTPISSQRLSEPFGVTGAGTAGASGINAGEFVTVFERGNYVKVIAAASLGVGADVAVVGATSSLTPVASSGTGGWVVGKSHTAAAAGEVFACKVDPRFTINGS